MQSQGTGDTTNLFVEQAEYLESAHFVEWTTAHPNEEVIQSKLIQSGAKLITGPRGCGKTTLLKKAYSEMLSNPKHRTLPVYVNYKSTLRLEPLYQTNANGNFWFNQWLIIKILLGLHDTLQRLGLDTVSAEEKSALDKVLSEIEFGRVDNLTTDVSYSIQELQRTIDDSLTKNGYKRCVLLLDDAAHAFSPDQQRDFFDFFRHVKSQSISPKAAIYPGVTVYSPAFHVGHDAEEIDVWVKPYDPEYLNFMKTLIGKRLPSNLVQGLEKDSSAYSLICFAAFGIPRALLNIVRAITDETLTTGTFKLSRAKVLRCIKESVQGTHANYTSLRLKLPTYSQFVETGAEVFNTIIDLIKAYNKDKHVQRQSLTIAIRNPIPLEMAKVLGFFQYSGLLLPRGDLSRGEKGVFDLYAVHYGVLVDRNALLGKKAVNIDDFANAFSNMNAHDFTRTNPNSLLSNKSIEDVFPLSLPTCQVCGTARINESAKFCLNCGTKLTSVSLFESLVSQAIGVLPISATMIGRITSESRLKTVKDILMDTENKELRKVKWIGPVRAARIYSYAEEFLA